MANLKANPAQSNATAQPSVVAEKGLTSISVIKVRETDVVNGLQTYAVQLQQSGTYKSNRQNDHVKTSFGNSAWAVSSNDKRSLWLNNIPEELIAFDEEGEVDLVATTELLSDAYQNEVHTLSDGTVIEGSTFDVMNEETNRPMVSIRKVRSTSPFYPKQQPYNVPLDFDISNATKFEWLEGTVTKNNVDETVLIAHLDGNPVYQLVGLTFTGEVDKDLTTTQATVVTRAAKPAAVVSKGKPAVKGKGTVAPRA